VHNHLCQISSGFCVPRTIKIGLFLTEFFINNGNISSTLLFTAVSECCVQYPQLLKGDDETSSAAEFWEGVLSPRNMVPEHKSTPSLDTSEYNSEQNDVKGSSTAEEEEENGLDSILRDTLSKYSGRRYVFFPVVFMWLDGNTLISNGVLLFLILE